MSDSCSTTKVEQKDENINYKLQVSCGNSITNEELLKKWKAGKLVLSYTSTMQSDRVSEAIEGAVPKGQNTPQQCSYGLYAEQLSGTSFTTPRVGNLRSWLYRILPSVKHGLFEETENGCLTNDFSKEKITPAQIRWNPLPMPKKSHKFHQGLVTICGAGSPESKSGMAIHMYTCNESMVNETFCNADGDFLIVPQEGDLLIRTEFGIMEVPVGFICVIQRGIHFCVMVKKPCRGYIAEIFQSHFVIPDLGPIGANGLANSRDFETVVASYEDQDKKEYVIIQKFLGQLFRYKRTSSMFDVVGWHGNYVPFRYDLRKFCAVNSVTYDHMDPSIFTVLTAPSSSPGVAVCDFVIFPPRWSVHTKTFRPPYYHRNCMSEYMGNIFGIYEAKKEGFLPGGGSLHSCMTAHGPDAQTFETASKEELVPVPPKEDSLSFMFESCYVFRVTKIALEPSFIQKNYNDCWQGLKSNFKAPAKL